ncbi:MAG TPA: ABC-F family ATP-binding cassette domain-containing protein [bacterium]|nr:ABC-F family ATP-binding cassette domain-containing protein [bacterium]
MGILVSCQNLTKSFGHRPLFENLSFGLFEGERTGLIGPNGMGKSTLLKILAGVEKQDEGTIAARKGLRVGYLPQQDQFEDREGLTVGDVLAQGLTGLGLEDWEIDVKVGAGLEEAGFTDPNQRVTKLSGGWRKRLAILTQVMRAPDLLLLDEPTNHLDLEGVLWLEGFMENLEFSFLVVTHDRRFLEKVSNRVIELNKRYPEGYFTNNGHYTDFLEKREDLFATQAKHEDTAANLVRREIEWLRRGPKARQTKQQARIDRAGELMGELDELRWRNSQGKSVNIDFAGSERQTKRLVSVEKVSKSLGGKKLFGPLDLLLTPGDKLGLLGENGSGKSTLLKLIAGVLPPDSGQVKQAEFLRVVTFDQHRDQLDLSQTLRLALCEKGDYVFYKEKPVHVASWAARFLFDRDQLDRPLSRFSGGEQSRVLIAQLMLKPADLLLLDEPTNDLDMPSLEVLEQSLMEFPGALVLVTHDRYLLDRVSQRILALDGKGQTATFADLSQWEAYREGNRGKDRVPDPAIPVATNSARGNVQPHSAGSEGPAALAKVTEGKSPAKAKPALSSKEKKELEGMEEKIHAQEGRVKAAQALLEDPSIASDAGKLSEKHELMVDEQAKLEWLFKRWEELEAKAKMI